MSAPIALIKASAYSSPPTNNTEYGKGSFLVGFFGESTKYSLDGQIWYEHPKNYEWTRGNAYEEFNNTSNNNDRTITFGGTPVFLDFLNISYSTTATSGNRDLYIYTSGSGTMGTFLQDNVTSNSLRVINLTPNGKFGTLGITSYLTSVLTISQPNWFSIRFLDVNDIDDNDDMITHACGAYALPKYHWIEFKNCKNFQVEKVIESLGDGIFTSGSTKPHSLKILKI